MDQGSAQHVLQMVDNALDNTEYQFLRMLDSNLTSSRELQSFFTASKDDVLKSTVVPAKRLTDFAVENALIDSIYMVRWSDHKVISNDTSTTLDEFEDKSLVEAYQGAANYGSWSGQRQYRTFKNQNPKNVVSLVRPYPVLNGDQGLVVININVNKILNLVQDIAGSKIVSVQLADQNNQIFEGITTHSDAPNNTMVQDTNAKVVSEKTGWQLHTEMRGNRYLQYTSILMYMLWIVGIAAVIGSALYITYISRKNYKPILKLTEQIEHYATKRAKHLFNRADKDEFSYIESALDKMIEETDDFIQQREEHLKHKKKLSLKALLDGQFEAVSKGLPEIEQLFGWSLRACEHTIIVAEIDKYADFQKQYSRRDQSLHKFVIMNVFNEVMGEHRLESEGDWALPNLWVAVVNKSDQNEHAIREAVEKILTWINEQLNFTITFGMGEAAERVEHIQHAYERSLEVLQYKSSLGGGRLIGYWDMPNPDDLNPVANMIQVQQLATQFKRQDAEWRTTYHDLIGKLKEQLLIKEDTWYLLNYLIYQLSADIYTLSSDYRKIWDQELLPRIHAVLNEADTLQEVEEQLFSLMERAEQEFMKLRSDRTYSATMQNVKQFIEEHHADSQLSLNFLSASFQLSPKYLSHLFKEETGEKFVDYLTEVRISHAQKLLHSTDHSIQSIAERVGYNHAFSFIRAFKKTIGFTPGDYRKSFQENEQRTVDMKIT
ncbi:AraC family transcriptional regulator [Paenibacillus agaridevorans]|nr:AraC family transcriptional regulator [Paenibacillus agaridevorans]